MKLRTSTKESSLATTIYLAATTDQLPNDTALAATFAQLSPQAHSLNVGVEGELRYCLRVDPEASYEKWQEAARLLSHQSCKHWSKDLVLDSYLEGENSQILSAVAGGLSLGRYRLGKWKSEEPTSHHEFNFSFKKKGVAVAINSSTDPILGISESEPAALVAIRQSLLLAEVELRMMDLVNAPANKKRPQDLARWAEDSARTYNYQATIYDKQACIEMGMDALLAVNRGSEDGAQLIVLEYRGKGVAEGAPTALVGKGVTFDTGGLSIKPATNMHLMKSDMGGAAAVLGTMEAAARLALPVHLVGIVPATDNSVDALSIKPSDVINSYSKKTIEIIDTDAEGRLILSDGLAYVIKHFSPARIVSLATLTGSAVRTFGYYCAALFSKDESLARSLQEAGDQAGQRCWPLPPWDEYAAHLKSDVADIKNYSGKPISGATDAFKFLEFFTDDHPHYAHLDIAGTALKAGPYASDRQATAYGLRLLIEWLKQ